MVVDPAVSNRVSIRWIFEADRVHFRDRLDPPVWTAIEGNGRTPAVVRKGWFATFFEPPSSGTIDVQLDDPRFAEVEIPRLLAGQQHIAELQGNATLTLDLRGPDGQALPSALIAVTRTGSDHELFLHDGRTPLDDPRFERMIPGSYKLRARSAGLAATTSVIDLEPGEKRHVELKLDPVAYMTGTARYADGRPVAGAAISAALPAREPHLDRDRSFVIPIGGGSSSNNGSRVRVARGSVRADGTFELFLPEPAEVYALLEPGSLRHWIGPVKVAHGSPTHVDFEVPEPASLAGSIMLPAHLSPRSFRLLLWSHQGPFGGNPRRLEIDSASRFTGRNLPTGDFELFLVRRSPTYEGSMGDAPIGSLKVGSVTLSAGEHTAIELAHPNIEWSNLTLRCQVAGPFGDAVRIAVVETPRDWWSFDETSFQNLVDGEAGPFLLPQGAHRVYVEGENWTMGSFKTIEPSPGVDERMDLEVDLVEASVLVEFEGVLARNRKFTAWTPDGFTNTWTIDCDDDGRATVRLPRGESSLAIERGMGAGPIVCPVHWPVSEGILRLEEK